MANVNGTLGRRGTSLGSLWLT